MVEFSRVARLPQYVFEIIHEKKCEQEALGNHVIDLGMGNPDQPTPQHIIDAHSRALTAQGATRYSASRGIPCLRQAVCDWYQQYFNVDLNADKETVVTIGSKEGLAHLALATTGAGDQVFVPSPAYPIHTYGFVISGAEVVHIPLVDTPAVFLEQLKHKLDKAQQKPTMMVLNFPSNPTTDCVDLAFFEEVVALAKHHKVWVVHDLAYAQLCFDGYQAPSILQVPGAKDIAVEAYSLSKTYNMPGWRVGFISGNQELVHALTRLKSYMDYGMFEPIQYAAHAALIGPQECVTEICSRYQQRRDVLCQALKDYADWDVTPPQATMFVWAKIPRRYKALGSLAFTEHLIKNAHVALSPGIGFGQAGDQHVRLSLIEDDDILIKACQAIGKVFNQGDDGKRIAVAGG